MTRLFALLPLIVGALASLGSLDSDDKEGMAPSSESMDVMGGKSDTHDDSSFDSSYSKEEGINIQIGDVHIKIVGVFDGLSKWKWDGDRPGEDATIHQVQLLE